MEIFLYQGVVKRHFQTLPKISIIWYIPYASDCIHSLALSTALFSCANHHTQNIHTSQFLVEETICDSSCYISQHPKGGTRHCKLATEKLATNSPTCKKNLSEHSYTLYSINFKTLFFFHVLTPLKQGSIFPLMASYNYNWVCFIFLRGKLF